MRPPPPAAGAAAATAPQQPFALRLLFLAQVADLPSLKRRMAELEEAAGASDLWEQRARATAVLQQLTALREEVAALERFCGQLEDLGVAMELLEMEVRQGRVAAGGRGSCGMLPVLNAEGRHLRALARAQPPHRWPCRTRRARRRWRQRRDPSATGWQPAWRPGSCGGCWGARTTTEERC